MRLRALTVEGFRGFCDRQLIQFSGELTIVYGPNGTGKTSLGEALEWLLYGRTSKRQRGDEVSKTEYRESYRNIHFAGPGKPSVGLEIELPGGTQCVLRRELNDDETSGLMLNGAPCADFSQVGVISEFDRPMILQHTLQDFIHMEPKRRYRALSSIMGLEDLITFRGHVDTLQGRSGYARGKPPRVQKAREFFDRLSTEASAFEETRNLSKTLAKPSVASLPQIRSQLRALASAASGDGLDEQHVADRLRSALTEREKAVVDWGSYRVREETGEDGPSAWNKLAESSQRVKSAVYACTDGQQAADALGETLRTFYQVGLSLCPDRDPKLCPFCAQESLSAKRMEEIRGVLASTAPAAEQRERAHKAVAAARTDVEQAAVDLRRCLPKPPDADGWEMLARIVSDGDQDSLRALRSAAATLAVSQASWESSVSALLASIDDVLSPRHPIEPLRTEFGSPLSALGVATEGMRSALSTYAAAYDALTPSVNRSIATRTEVRYIRFLGEAWEGWPDVSIAVYDIQAEALILGFRKKVMDFIKRKQTELLDEKQREITEWYRALNPDEGVTFSKISVATDALHLVAESYGTEMAAAPNLSCSHLNCVGLAVYLACATRAGCPFGFLFIDDPVQSMDEDHSEAFRLRVLRRLLDEGRQLVVLTHLEHFAGGIDTLYRRQVDVHRLQFRSYSKAGPEIIETLPAIQEHAKHAREHMEATNSEYRGIAIQHLRKFTERFVKDLYVADNGVPVSRRFEDVAWSRLKPLLLQCPSFDPCDEGRLEGIHNFASRHLHVDDSAPQSVPQSHQIRPHVAEAEALIGKYQSVLGIEST
jgi:energy-coupling factor transporter ATP-binding protein EcfA2